MGNGTALLLLLQLSKCGLVDFPRVDLDESGSRDPGASAALHKVLSNMSVGLGSDATKAERSISLLHLVSKLKPEQAFIAASSMALARGNIMDIYEIIGSPAPAHDAFSATCDYVRENMDANASPKHPFSTSNGQNSWKVLINTADCSRNKPDRLLEAMS